MYPSLNFQVILLFINNVIDSENASAIDQPCEEIRTFLNKLLLGSSSAYG